MVEALFSAFLLIIGQMIIIGEKFRNSLSRANIWITLNLSLSYEIIISYKSYSSIIFSCCIAAIPTLYTMK